MSGKRGRPRLAARTLEEAVNAVHNGTAPHRPRNDFEREAAVKKKLGRRVNPHSTHRVIAEAASYLIDRDGMEPSAAVAEACKHAREAVGDGRRVDPANVRKALRELRRPRTIRCEYTGTVGPWAACMPDAVDVPFLHAVQDVGIGAPAALDDQAQE